MNLTLNIPIPPRAIDALTTSISTALEDSFEYLFEDPHDDPDWREFTETLRSEVLARVQDNPSFRERVINDAVANALARPGRM